MDNVRVKSVDYSNRFLKRASRLPKKIIKLANEKEAIFHSNPFEVSLRIHKLSGKDKNCWAFWIDYNYRIKFIFLASNEVLFLEIGKHNIYK